MLSLPTFSLMKVHCSNSAFWSSSMFLLDLCEVLYLTIILALHCDVRLWWWSSSYIETYGSHSSPRSRTASDANCAQVTSFSHFEISLVTRHTFGWIYFFVCYLNIVIVHLMISLWEVRTWSMVVALTSWYYLFLQPRRRSPWSCPRLRAWCPGTNDG